MDKETLEVLKKDLLMELKVYDVWSDDICRYHESYNIVAKLFLHGKEISCESRLIQGCS